MNTPDFEKQIGIETFCTNEPGIGGKLRVHVEDFHVTELFLYPPKNDQGHFTIAEVSARNWETNTLVHEIADKLHLSKRRISFAGNKDKRSWSTQLMSFERVPSELLAQLRIKNVSFKNIYHSNIPVRIGDLLGNRFEITVRNIDTTITPEHIKRLISPIETWGGFPNYYGIQRFGVIRPITHLVGKYILQGDFEKAAMVYIGHPVKEENELTYKLRDELEKTRNYTKAYHLYPKTLNFEKAILNRLIQDPQDFISALKELPKNLLLLFINAFESFIFNKILSERIRRKISIHQAIVGDIIYPVRKNTITNEIIPVKESNIEKVNKQLSQKKAVITGLLAGYNTVFADGEMGEIEHSVIDSQGIDLRDFIIPEIPFLSSSGSRRSLLALLPSLKWKIHTDDLSKEHQVLNLFFELQKGCYATSLLREILKSNNPRDY